jgi:hypothetical protein
MVFGAPQLARDPHAATKGLAILCRGGGEFGSLACIARLGGQRFMLGCAHVMALAGNGIPGADVILGGDDKRELGRLSDVAGEIVFHPGGLNLLDAALARVTDAHLSESIGGWGPPARSAPYHVEHQKVYVCGATSGPATARIADPAWSGFITYRGDQRAYFSGLVQVKPACGAPGDSGAAVLNDKMELVGVNIASDGDAYSLFCPIKTIKGRWPDLKIGADP